VIDKPSDYAAIHGEGSAIGSATWRPTCPDCGFKMNYEDDRDENGQLSQAPWWECPGCLTSISIMRDPRRN
jgi:hypothetical protein